MHARAADLLARGYAHASALSITRLCPRPQRASREVPLAADAVPTATPTGVQRSSRLLSMRGANALLLLPARTDAVPTLDGGIRVQALLLSPLAVA